MKNDFLKNMLEDCKELLSVPQTMAEVLRVTSDEDYAASELADVLMRDPALTTRLLRIVNSPFYGAGRSIGSMTQAVVTLGSRQVVSIALAASVYDLTNGKSTELDRVAFWRHSLEVAIASRMIAEGLGVKPTEEIFVAGLLHDIGLLFLSHSYPEQCRAIWKRAAGGEPLTEVEEEVWGTNHARVGQFVLEQWHLPASICEAVGHHHNIFPEGSRNSDLIPSQIVSLANLISRFSSLPPMVRDIRSAAECKVALLSNLQLPTEQLNLIEEQLFARTVEEAAYLEIDVGEPADILTEANRLLLKQYLAVESLLKENQKMQNQMSAEKIQKAALESMRTMALTLNTYINNASAIINGRAKLVLAGLQDGTLPDRDGQLATAMEVISRSVETIDTVVDELKSASDLRNTASGGDDRMRTIEAKIKSRLAEVDEAEPAIA